MVPPYGRAGLASKTAGPAGKSRKMEVLRLNINELNGDWSIVMFDYQTGIVAINIISNMTVVYTYHHISKG